MNNVTLFNKNTRQNAFNGFLEWMYDFLTSTSEILLFAKAVILATIIYALYYCFRDRIRELRRELSKFLFEDSAPTSNRIEMRVSIPLRPEWLTNSNTAPPNEIHSTWPIESNVQAAPGKLETCGDPAEASDRLDIDSNQTLTFDACSTISPCDQPSTCRLSDLGFDSYLMPTPDPRPTISTDDELTTYPSIYIPFLDPQFMQDEEQERRRFLVNADQSNVQGSQIQTNDPPDPTNTPENLEARPHSAGAGHLDDRGNQRQICNAESRTSSEDLGTCLLFKSAGHSDDSDSHTETFHPNPAVTLQNLRACRVFEGTDYSVHSGSQTESYHPDFAVMSHLRACPISKSPTLSENADRHQVLIRDVDSTISLEDLAIHLPLESADHSDDSSS